MRFCRIVGIYRCESPSIYEIPTKTPLVSKANMDFWRLMDSAALVHALFLVCPSYSALKVGDFVSSPILSMGLPACSLSGWFWSKYSVLTSFRFSVSLIISTGSPSSRSALSVSCLKP